MARIARVVLPGYPHHITQRGVRSLPVFFTESDRINFRENVRGYLFQGRFFSCPLDNSHLLAAVRYTERNPVRAKICRHAWDYPWSSAAYYTGKAERDMLITESEVLADIDGWQIFLSEKDADLEPLRKKTRTGRPFGPAQFLNNAEVITQRVLQGRKAGRPKKN